MIDRNPIDVDRPEPITWHPPNTDASGKVIAAKHAAAFRERRGQLITVCDQAQQDIRQVRKDQMRGVGHILDGQAMLSRLKVAAALAILESRYEILDEDWQLSGYIMAKSDETRSGIEAELRERSERQSKARGTAAGVQKATADETELEIKTQAAAKAIRTRLEGRGWLSRSEIRNGIRKVHRAYFDDAMEHLEGAGFVEERAVTGTGQPGTEYRLKP
jgi:hypothetical protein